MTQEEIWLRLMGITGLGNEKIRQVANKLVKTSCFDASLLSSAGLSKDQSEAFLCSERPDVVQGLRWLENPNHHLLTSNDVHFPQQLKNIAHYPAVLFVAGNVEVLSTLQVAVVGSRHCSHYGRKWGESFSLSLARSGFTITSGLAFGIDAVAHRAALTIGGKTIAVLGSGFNNLYPRQHLILAENIVASGGALVSEFAINHPPYARNFPRRNRIISGLSRGVLVVEASLKSGSLVTARYALEQNRDVFALPGSLDSPVSEGVHWLIQQGASLVIHPDNIVEQLGGNFNWLPGQRSLLEEAEESTSTDQIAPSFLPVFNNVVGDVTSVDVIVERTGQAVPAVVSQLIELELAGWIGAVPGGYVRLKN